jgi:crotonobetainyl-CoA:carnitine CoA-transferase CaiB-like acyl-CoA transferase
MRAALTEIMLTKTADEWERVLSAADVPDGRVRTPHEAVALNHVDARGFLSELPPVEGIENIRVPTAAFSFREGGPQISSPPPCFGEHTDEILATLDFNAEQIAQLRKEGVVWSDRQSFLRPGE